MFVRMSTSDLTADKKPDEICSEISQLVKVLYANKNKIVISNIVPRGDACNTKVEKVNSLLKKFCENNSIDLISHDNINVKRHSREESYTSMMQVDLDLSEILEIF